MIRRATVITDCHCPNATVRQTVAWPTLAGTDQPLITPIHGDVDGAGMLVDALVEARGEKWTVFCQSSPRDASAKKGDNGSKFGYFETGKALVIVSLDGYMLSLAKRVGLVTQSTNIRAMDIPDVLEYVVRCKQLTEEEAEIIRRSQFRSLKFVPRAARWIQNGIQIPTTEFEFSNIPEFGNRVWFVDNFGNCKTSLRRSDVPQFAEGWEVETSFGKLTCYEGLRSVPQGQAALIVGSSGIEGDEFLEVVVQGVGSGSAQKCFGLSLGDTFEVL